MIFQELYLKKGERAVCEIKNPRKSKLFVECIKDFSEGGFLNLTNKPLSFVKTLKKSSKELTTNHLFSNDWSKLNTT